MTPLALRIKNFRSFKEEQKFYFPQEPGLYFMQGVNEVEPALGGNGTGKTSIWEALTWCLFGVTAEGLKAGDVCNWSVSKDVMVALIFLGPGGAPMMVRRTWGPISWTLHACSDDLQEDGEHVVDLAKDGANELMALLGLELEPWLMSVLMAQGRPMFLDLKAEAQATLFSEVLGLERWVEYGRRMTERARETDEKLRRLERDQSRLQGELAAAEQVDFSKAHDDWEVERMRKLLLLDTDHKKGVASLKDLREALEVAEKREEVAREAVRAAQGDPDDEKELRGFDEIIRGIEDHLTRHEVELEALATHTDKLKAAGKCPTCGAELTEAHRREELARATQAYDQTRQLVARLEERLRKVRSKKGNVVGRVRLQEERLARAQEELGDCQRVTSGARRSLDLQERELDRIEEEAERLEGEENPYAGMARQATRNASRLRNELAEARTALEALSERYSLQSYWASRGFKEIRLQEIAHALTELEIEVNSAVTALGLHDWELRFAVDKEGKGGGIQRGFNVAVKSPKHDRATPWRSWSGGERQRLRLAANMGLGDLIRSRVGSSIPLEVWDEPTNGLSPEGWRDLFESLAARARLEQRVIFITDHKAHDFGGFAGTATVIKRPSGSTVRTSWSRV